VNCWPARAALRWLPKTASADRLVSVIYHRPDARKAYKGPQEMDLSFKEFDLLAELMRSWGCFYPATCQPVPRQLCEVAHVDVHGWLVRKLRWNLRYPNGYHHSEFGYRFEGEIKY
jgi:hypothetical protein